LPLYLRLRSKQSVSLQQALLQAASAVRPECKGAEPGPDGFGPIYSDLGYLLLGEALVSACGVDLDALIAEEVTKPLGLDMGSARQWIHRCHDFPKSVAPTEHVAWRGGVLSGVVHDENAWALAGHGIAGHAGLFATVESVVRFGAAILDALRGRSDWLRPGHARELVRPRLGGTLRAGFDGKSQSGSAAGVHAGPSTFGHLGFTGTSFWCDPDAQSVTVLLTNRVHPTRHNALIRAARPRVHDALLELASECAR
jgi:CubicO group peptidase (beta-lactamase class C family)